MKASDQRPSLYFVLPVLALYGIISAVGLHYHELFLDEAHHFLVSRDSGSLGEMYYNLRYDGHPRLWGALLFFITHYITTDPTGMQVLQWLFAMATAFVLVRYAPFEPWMKVLILAGYYFVFEYDLLSRDYAIGIWMLFLCCHLLRDARKHAWWIGVLVLLMCSAHIFFAVASAGILLYLLTDFIMGRRTDGGGRQRWPSGRLAGLCALIVLGLVTALIQAQTPSVDNANMRSIRPEEWLSWKNMSFTLDAVVQGWLPIPQVNGGRFWNTCWLTANHLGMFFPVLLSLALLLFPAYLLRRDRRALLFYYGAIGPLLVFFDLTQMTGARYFGMLYIFFLAAAWLTADGSGPVFSRASISRGPWGTGWHVAWVGILVIQVLVGGYAFGQDLGRPFSQSRNAAAYLARLHPAEGPVVVDGYTAGPMLCAYLRRKLYYLDTGAPGSFCVWKKEYFPIPRPGIAAELAARPALKQLGKFVLVSNRRLGADSGEVAGEGYRLTALKSFENSIVGENYFIYEIDPVDEPGHPLP